MATNITATGTTHGLQIKADRTSGNQATGDYNIWVENLNMTDVRQPLAIGADGSSRLDDPPPPVTPTTPNIHDVTIKTATAIGATEASRIVGLPEACIRNVVLDHVSIAAGGAGIELQNMTGTFTNVTGTPSGGKPLLVVGENATVAAVGTTPPLANSVSSNAPCGRDPEN